MRVLILSCNTGQGHNACGAALEEVFSAHGDTCEMMDGLKFLSGGVSRLASNWHTRIYRHMPFLFRSGYRYAEEHPALFQEKSAVYRLLAAGEEKLYRFLQEHPYDAIICAHVFPGVMLTALQQHHQLACKTAFLATDYTCSPIVGECEMDWYLIPDDALADDFVYCGVPRERIIGTGIPVRSAFLHREDREAAKAALGLDAAGKHLLVMSGSMGCGPIGQLMEYLDRSLPRDVAVTVVCGTNRRLQTALTRRFSGRPQFRILGFTDQISRLMDSADLYLTKPGGISVTEAAAKGLPMAFVDAVAGCESYNMHYFIERGGAVTADTPEGLADICTQLLKDDQRRERMSRRLEELQIGGGAEKIYEILAGDPVCVP